MAGKGFIKVTNKHPWKRVGVGKGGEVIPKVETGLEIRASVYHSK